MVQWVENLLTRCTLGLVTQMYHDPSGVPWPCGVKVKVKVTR